MIDVTSIRKNYGSTRAVQDVSFRVAKGEVLGFLGPNGAGKSTTIRMLTCFIPPDAGSARIDGFDVTTHSLEVRRRIGYLPENNPLYMDMGVLEYLHFVAGMRAIASRQRRSAVGRAVERCGLGPMAARNIGQLSKGYRQRLGLAQALIHDPAILLLDEPTIGLDPHQIIGMRALIRDIGREKTVVLSSHILPEVAATCDRVLIMSSGRIVGSGTPAELSAMASGGQEILVGIRAQQDRIEAVLGALPFIHAVTPAGECDGVYRYSLRADGDQDVSERIFQVAVQNGWSLTELQRKAINLEEVFLHLTTREAI
jgi:ABC-2 type transport system ATP-binding protein